MAPVERVLECQFKSELAHSSPLTTPEAKNVPLSSSSSSAPSSSSSTSQDHEELKRLELTYAELRLKSKQFSQKTLSKVGRALDSGIIPFGAPFSAIFAVTPECMFPPALVFFICIIAYLLAKFI